MKRVFILCLSLFIAGHLFAFDNLNLGIGAEINSNTREGIAAGGVLFFCAEINQQFSAGGKFTFSHNFDTVITLEPQALFRYYLPLGIEGLFVQAELGAAIFLENDNSYPAFSGGLSGGWRFEIGTNFYFEPYLRFGYPYIWGVGFISGMKILIGSGIN
ncbi:MAG: hypothetical protein LBI28_02940 [Treponema sp.]|jgi:hypothetical protein|nr:hypothetical protein [Treponema sp.]